MYSAALFLKCNVEVAMVYRGGRKKRNRMPRLGLLSVGDEGWEMGVG